MPELEDEVPRSQADLNNAHIISLPSITGFQEALRITLAPLKPASYSVNKVKSQPNYRYILTMINGKNAIDNYLEP